MGKTQREKGKRGERELAGVFREYGYDARRGQQYCGAAGNADVIGLPGGIPQAGSLRMACDHAAFRLDKNLPGVGGWEK